MAKYLANARSYGDVTGAIWTAPLGTTAPTVPLPTAIGTGWYELGFTNDTGVVENENYQETKKYTWQGATLARTLRSQFEFSFTFYALEENAAVMGLRWPGRTATTVGTTTAEVQTVTITGTPTGGTWNLSFNGNLVSGLAFNVPTATLAATLLASLGITVTVTGTAGTSYVLTYPANMGNVPAATVTSAFTGGASPAISIATTTPGVSPTYSQPFGPSPSQNLRSWAIDLVDGGVHHRKYVPQGEAVATGTVANVATDLTAVQFVTNCYVDSAGNWGYDLHDNIFAAPGLFS